MKKLLISGTAGLALAAGALIFAQGPMVNIGNRHPNLRAAQQSMAESFRYIERAQGANRGRLGGHAERAKALLAQASQELRMAADYANHRR